MSDRKPKPTGTLMVNKANDGLLHEPLPEDVADRLTALICECLTPQQSAAIDDLLEPYGLKAGLVTITGYEHAFETYEAEPDCKD